MCYYNPTQKPVLGGHNFCPPRQNTAFTGNPGGLVVFPMGQQPWLELRRLRLGFLNHLIRAHQYVYEMLCRVEVLGESVLTETVLAGKAQIKRLHLRLSADAYDSQRNAWRKENKDSTEPISASLLKNKNNSMIMNSPSSLFVLKPSLR